MHSTSQDVILIFYSQSTDPSLKMTSLTEMLNTRNFAEIK